MSQGVDQHAGPRTTTNGDRLDNVNETQGSSPTAAAATDLNISIQQLTDELMLLNEQSSRIATHVYQRQTPKRQQTQASRRSLSSPRRQPLSSAANPRGTYECRTSPRATPRHRLGLPTSCKKQQFSPRFLPSHTPKVSATKTVVSPRGNISSQLKLKTKRKLYADSLEHGCGLDMASLANDELGEWNW